MSRWLPERPRLEMGWGADGVAWRAAHDAVRVDEPQAAVRDAATTTGTRSLAITAGNDIAVHWMQQPPSALQSLAELRQVAHLRCAQLFGGGADDWWVAGDWQADRPFACAALPRRGLRVLLEAAHSLRLSVHWDTAWSAACRRTAHATPRLGWNALRSPTAAMLWHCTEGRVDCVARVAIRHEHSQDDVQARIEQQVALECLREPCLQASPVRWHPAPGGRGPSACEAQAALGWALALAERST